MAARVIDSAGISTPTQLLGDRTKPINPMFLWGVGNPEGFIEAFIGTLYVNLEGSSSRTLYVKETTTGPTGWRRVQTLPA